MKKNIFTEKFIKRLSRIDHTDIEQYVHRLIEDRHVIQTVFDRLPEGIILVNPKGEIILANDVASDFLGINLQDQINKPVQNVIQNPSLKKFIDTHLGSEKRVLNEEFDLHTSRSRIVDLNIYPFFSDNNERAGTVLTFHDVTDKSSSDRKMFHFEKLESILKLAAGIAHEMGNPLNAVHIHTALLEKEARKCDSATRDRISSHISAIKEEISRLDHIIRKFLSAARQKNTQFSEANINTIITNLLTSMKTEFKAKNIRLSLKLANELPSTFCDADKLSQVFSNLIRNSIQAMNEGGDLNIATQFKKPGIYISISDSGTGISEADLPHIFDPFFSTKGGGSGLGLMLVLDIIREHGGKIDVNSKQGEGTTMTIFLPVRREKAQLPFNKEAST